MPATFAIDHKGWTPCKTACPVHTSAQGYVALVAEGRYEDAYRVASEPNPFPSVCGRICTHVCETDCTRGKVEEPIAIAGIKRFVADNGAPADLPQPLPVFYDEKIAIVGSGPAGLTAARDLAQLGYATTVFEALPVAGGMLRVGIPEYRLPHAVLQARSTQITALGVDTLQPALRQRLHRRLAVRRRLQGRLPGHRPAPEQRAAAARPRARRRACAPSSSCARRRWARSPPWASAWSWSAAAT